MRNEIIALVKLHDSKEAEELAAELYPKDRVVCSSVGSCPGAASHSSEYVQSMGCLPSLYDIVQMKVKHGKTWACHSDYTKPCIGAMRELKRRNLPHKPSKELLTLEDPWEDYIK